MTEKANVFVTDNPPGLATITLRVVVKAFEAMDACTFNCVELIKVVVVVTLPPVIETVEPGTNPLPLTVMVNDVPFLPDDGETESIASSAVGGGGALITSVCAVVELTPPLPSLTVNAIKCVPIGSFTLAMAVLAI